MLYSINHFAICLSNQQLVHIKLNVVCQLCLNEAGKKILQTKHFLKKCYLLQKKKPKCRMKLTSLLIMVGFSNEF